MTRPHVTDFYMDGHVTVPFCKICSAEGLALLEDCPQKIIIHDPNWDLTDNKKKLNKKH